MNAVDHGGRPAFLAPYLLPARSIPRQRNAPPVLRAHASASQPMNPTEPIQHSTFDAPSTVLAGLRSTAASLALAALTLTSATVPNASSPPTASALAFTAAPRRRARIRNAAIAIPNMPRLPWTRSTRRALTASELAAAGARRRIATEALGVFEARYVDVGGVCWSRIRARVERAALRSDEELRETLRWAFSRANDAYTRYLPALELAGMRDGIDGEMCGVGIIFSAETRGWRRAKRVVIRDVVRNSPAADAGLMRGDEITAIDMAAVTSMSVDEATARLLGRDGGRVLLSFVRATKGRGRVELSVSLTRRRFEVPTVAHEIVYVPAVGDVAFMQVRDFAANTAAQARTAMRCIARHRVSALVLDLRGNSGGLVDQAVAFAKLFLPPGRVVVLFVGRGGRVSMECTKTRWAPWKSVRAPDVPVLVLADERTASASELVAAALRDNCRAVIVGARTFGKGSVQAVVPLSDGAGVAVTVAAYRTPRGRRIADGQGLRPDLFRGDLNDDAGAVEQVFKGGARKRMRWVRSKIARCDVPSGEVEELLGRKVEWWKFWRRFGIGGGQNRNR